MAKYRQVHVEFWQDGFVLDLTPEEKYFYLYLMTNSKTSQCGIYELPLRIIETETGYNRETVTKLIKRFISYGKINYDSGTKEVMIINWLKFNRIASPKVIACVNKEVSQIKSKSFKNAFISTSKQYGYPIDTLSIDYGEEEEKEEEKEEEEKENKNSIYSNEFEQFWSIYPRKIDKKKAAKSFKSAMRNHSLKKILIGTDMYAKQVLNTAKQYIKHPATFLNNDSFIDGYEEREENAKDTAELLKEYDLGF
ncbi:replication protein [Metabacillus indicus]|uniref:replication protein n=1 Tax=Metabacillus indicus TaxID=246786 RepID=UPI002A01AFCE|nr:replication protein [Metabacillus indicus]MDX8291442.1 replication protein [Metabacillus indicus]